MEKYRQLFGDLRYIEDSTKTDLSFVVATLGVAMGKPTIRDLKILTTTLRYIKKTRNFGLHFRKEMDHINTTV